MPEPPDPAGPPGPLLASGRAADVFDLGDGTVLRRYRIDHDTATEARVMTWAAGQGLPVPRVHHASGRDLVMDRVGGPTMLEALEQSPRTFLARAATLADLQRRVAALRAPAWLRRCSHGPPGEALLHLDLHPMNVLLAPDGPVLIDWTNAARGPAELDAAYTYVLMSTVGSDRRLQRVGQRLFSDTFARRRGRSTVRAQLRAACDLRLADPATTAVERTAILRLRDSRRAR